MTVPIGCSLTRNQLRDRGASLLPGLAARASCVCPTDDGYVLRFAPEDRDVATAIGACLDAERHCCPFLRFDLTVPSESGAIELVITGPAGTGAFLDALLTAWART